MILNQDFLKKNWGEGQGYKVKFAIMLFLKKNHYTELFE